MSNQQHTPEFGKASSTKNNVTFAETDDLAAVTAQVIGGTKEVNRLYARRIVACVNACAGIPTAQLEAYQGAVMRVMKERDELLADVAEEAAVREKLATLLAETAVALKGPEAALFRHSWHDLAEVAAGVVKQRDELLALLEHAAQALESGVQYAQDCHDEPPSPASKWDYEAYLLSGEIDAAIARAKGGEAC